MSNVSLSVRVRIDQKAALVNGKVLGPEEMVTVSREGMGEHWESFVKDLKQEDGGWAWSEVRLSDADPGLISGWYRERKDRESEARAKVEAELSELERIVKEGAFEDCPHCVDFSGSEIVYRKGSGRYQFAGFNRPITCWYSTSGASVTDQAARAEYFARHSALEAENSRILKEKNDAAFAAYLPGAQVAYEIECMEREQLMLEKEEKEEEARRARAAKRLESGYWEKETPSYNERRHGAFWCAAVSFGDGPKPIYTWGESTGKWGQAGMLRVPCKPGDIIAWGQKDNRRPDKSDHYLLIMQEDGSMVETDKTAAWKHWQEKHAINA